MIKRVTLENWTSHRKSELEFGKGTNVIVGKMGAGKTSVMNAICFGLFGTFPALNTKKLSLDEVIMRKPVEMDSALVKIEFDYNGENYSVERTILRKGTNTAKLYRNGAIVAGPKTRDVNEAIERIMEIDYNLFSRAVYSEQNQIDFFLRLSPAQRKEKFDDLLQLDRYEKVRGMAVTVSNRLKGICKDRKNFLNELKSGFDGKELGGLQKKLAEKKVWVKGLEKKQGEDSAKLKDAEKAVSELAEKEKEFKILNELKIGASAKIDEFEKEIKIYREKLAGKSAEKMRALVEEDNEFLRNADKKIRVFEEAVDKNQSGLNTAVQKIGVNKKRIVDLDKHYNDLQNLGAECPLCRSELSEGSRGELLAENRSGKEKLLGENDKIAAEEKKFSAAIENEKNGRRKVLEEIETARKRQVETREILKLFEDAEDKEKSAKNLKEELGKIVEKLSGLKFDEKYAEEKRGEMLSLKNAVEFAGKEIAGSAELVREIGDNIKRMEGAEKQMLEIDGEIKNLETVSEKVDLFTNALKATQAELRHVLVESINHAMDSIWGKLYPYKDYVSAKMVIEDGNYELKVRERNGGWLRVEGILSGGERSAAAICIRMAFSFVLTRNLSWIILDEPTHNLDSLAVKELSSMLRSHLPELVDQIFVITHDKEMEKAASSNIYVFERDKDSNGATKPLLGELTA